MGIEGGAHKPARINQIEDEKSGTNDAAAKRAEGYRLSKKEAKSDRDYYAKGLRNERSSKRKEERYVSERTTEIADKKLSHHEATEQLSRLETERDAAANTLAGRMKEYLRIRTAKDRRYEQELGAAHEAVANTLAAHDEALKVKPTGWRSRDESGNEDFGPSLKRIEYSEERIRALRESVTKLYEELPDRSVENVGPTNDAIFVHTILEDPQLRHNQNSNVSAETTLEDDLDILLALEPSISASTVIPGAVDEAGRASGLWDNGYIEDGRGRRGSVGGVIIGRGRIGEVSGGDAGTIAHGLYERRNPGGAPLGDAARLGKIAGKKEGVGGYNELVVNQPEAVGYFRSCDRDEKGTLWANPETKETFADLHTEYARLLGDDSRKIYEGNLDAFQKGIKKYRNEIKAVHERGLPFYAMTQDRRFFEVKNVADNGTLEVGEELTPEEVSQKQSLSLEKRSEIAGRLAGRETTLFKDQRAQREAGEVLARLRQRSGSANQI